MDETLTLQADPLVRARLRTVFWIRLSSCVSMIVPALAMTVFLWLQGRGEVEPVLPGGEAPPTDALPSMVAVVWSVWLPLAFLCLLSGAILAWLAWRSYLGYTRTFRLTPEGIEQKDLAGARRLKWKDVTALEIGDDYTVRGRREVFRLPVDWLGREPAEAAAAYLKARVPREKTTTVSGPLEIALERAMKAAPVVMAALVAAIAAVATYWIFLRPS